MDLEKFRRAFHSGDTKKVLRLGESCGRESNDGEEWRLLRLEGVSVASGTDIKQKHPSSDGTVELELPIGGDDVKIMKGKLEKEKGSNVNCALLFDEETGEFVLERIANSATCFVNETAKGKRNERDDDAGAEAEEEVSV